MLRPKNVYYWLCSTVLLFRSAQSAGIRASSQRGLHDTGSTPWHFFASSTSHVVWDQDPLTTWIPPPDLIDALVLAECEAISCRGHCGENLNIGEEPHCSCDPACIAYDDCCWDFRDSCMTHWFEGMSRWGILAGNCQKIFNCRNGSYKIAHTCGEAVEATTPFVFVTHGIYNLPVAPNFLRHVKNWYDYVYDKTHHILYATDIDYEVGKQNDSEKAYVPIRVVLQVYESQLHIRNVEMAAVPSLKLRNCYFPRLMQCNGKLGWPIDVDKTCLAYRTQPDARINVTSEADGIEERYPECQVLQPNHGEDNFPFIDNATLITARVSKVPGTTSVYTVDFDENYPAVKTVLCDSVTDLSECRALACHEGYIFTADAQCVITSKSVSMKSRGPWLLLAALHMWLGVH